MSPYIHKTLPTLGNEKEQQKIKFNEKLLGDLNFSWATKILKMFYFTHWTGECSKSKVRPLDTVFLILQNQSL